MIESGVQMITVFFPHYNYAQLCISLSHKTAINHNLVYDYIVKKKKVKIASTFAKHHN